MGLSHPELTYDDAQSHAMIYDSRGPAPALLPDEPMTLHGAFAVDLLPTEELHPANRVHLAKVYCVDRDSAVKELGRVSEGYLLALLNEIRGELLGYDWW